MLNNANWIEGVWTVIACFAMWYAVQHYLLIHGDKSFVLASARNGIRLALVNKDMRAARERIIKIGLCLVAGICSLVTPAPIREGIVLLNLIIAGCFIGLLVLLAYGTWRDVKDREKIFERIIRERKLGDIDEIDKEDLIPIPVVIVQEAPVDVKVVIPSEETELGTTEKPMQVEVVQPPGGPVPVEVVEKEENTEENERKEK